VHQLPVALPDGRSGVVIRVYGVADDPKAPVSGWNATWFGRPMLDELRSLGLDLGKVWPGLPASEWTLWKRGAVSADDYRRGLGMCTLAHSHEQRVLHCGAGASCRGSPWQAALNGPTVPPCRRPIRAVCGPTGRLWQYRWPLPAQMSGRFWFTRQASAPWPRPDERSRAGAQSVQSAKPTEAAHLHYAASLFYAQTGLAREAEQARDAAFGMVQAAVQSGAYGQTGRLAGTWRHAQVVCEGPARIDMGGGWSDTPPFAWTGAAPC